VIGPLASAAAGDAGRPRAPGQLASHYAPSRPVRLDATTVAPDEALLAFGPDPPEGAARTLNLSARGDLEEAAANLFAMLRALDRPEFRAIAVMPVPAEGLGEAIRDRLLRAAAPRAGAPLDDLEA
jgi:L-threonylcarbamoyladenylate synthase